MLALHSINSELRVRELRGERSGIPDELSAALDIAIEFARIVRSRENGARHGVGDHLHHLERHRPVV